MKNNKTVSMNKEEAVMFLQELQNNPIFSNQYKRQIKGVIDFILANCDMGRDNEEDYTLFSEDTEIKSDIENADAFYGKNYVVYTDGGCLKNPGGNGGYGLIIFDNDNKISKKFSQGYFKTTNNRMELMGPLEALKKIPSGSNIILYSDSKYFCDSINKGWLESWTKNNWKNGTVKNIDLWSEFLLFYKNVNLEVRWVKGHADNDLNNECDKLATKAYSDLTNLIVDKGYIEK